MSGAADAGANAVPATYGRDLLGRLRALAEADPGRERCGLVVRVDGRLEAVALPNVAEDPRRAFELDPAALLRVHAGLAASGGEIVAAWHSHVDGGPHLSARDRAEAVVDGRPLLPGAEQLVLGMRGGRVTEIHRYRFEGGSFLEVVLPEAAPGRGAAPAA